MLNKKTSTPLVLHLKPSPFLQKSFLMMHCLALIASLLTSLPFMIKLSLSVLITSNYWLAHRRFYVENRSISYHDNQGWRITDNGEALPVHILSSTVVTRWLIFLHTQERSPMLIAKDMLTDNEFRQLIVKLKINFNHTAPST